MKWWPLSVCAFGLCIVALAAACKRDEAPAALSPYLALDTEVVEGVEILYSDSARVRVRITGPLMLNKQDVNEPVQEFLKGVNVTFYAEGPIPVQTSTLVAKYALRRERAGEIIVRDSVVWKSTDGQMLETEELIWDEQKRLIYSKKFARITTPTEIIFGHGFRADQDFSNAHIQQVEGIISVNAPN